MHNKLEMQIKQLLKENFLKVTHKNSSVFSMSYDFNLENITDNLIESMYAKHLKEFADGNGKELEKRNGVAPISSLRSSAAMIFNLLGNESIQIIANEFNLLSDNYKVEYERKLYTLTKAELAPAHIDVLLRTSDDENYIFIESKMLEWFEKKDVRKLSKSYLNIERYFFQSAGKVFIKVFNRLLEKKDAYTYYDCTQMMKHSLGIYNAIKKDDLRKPLNLALVNCIWRVSDTSKLGAEEEYIEIFQKSISGFTEFKNDFQPIIDLFKAEFDLDLNLQLITHVDLLNMLESNSDYNQRYII